MKKYLMSLCAVILMFSFVQCGGAQVPGTKEGQTLIDVTVNDLEGNEVTLQDARGTDPVLLVFFATWCPPCRKEVPRLIELNEAYEEKGLKIVAISLDNAVKVLPDFIEENGITYRVLHDTSQAAARAYKVQGIPTNILADADGTIIFRGHEPPSVKEIESVLK